MEEDKKEELDTIYEDKDVVKPRSYPRMSKRMKKIVQYIEARLGAQILDLEMQPEDIKLIVEQSFEEIIHYMTDIYSVTVPFANCIDVKKYHIDNVESVMRAQDSILTGLPFEIPAMDLYNITGMYNMDNYVNAMLIKRNMNTIATDMEFYYDKPNRKLYVYANPNRPKQVTINFKPEYFTVEDIREQFWETKLRRMALAECKIITGRIRSKYTPNGAKFQLDGPTLLAEGTSELDKLRDELDTNKDIFTVLN